MWHSGALQAPVWLHRALSQDSTFGQLYRVESFPSTAEQRNQPEQPKAIQSPELLMAIEATL